MKLVFTLAWQKNILFAVQRETAFGDTVGVAANGCAKIRRLIHIKFRRCTAEQSFAHAAVGHRDAGGK
ncbi:hypothetical protein D3C87_2093590 [compost metagenome]